MTDRLHKSSSEMLTPFGVIGILIIGFANMAQAETFVVSRADAGPGSLLDAVEQASAKPGFDTITFAHDLIGATISVGANNGLRLDDADGVLVQGDLNADGFPDITLLQDGGVGRVLSIAPGASATISGIIITGAEQFSAIHNAGTLALVRCTIQGNEVDIEFDGDGFGGGIFNSGKMDILESMIHNNKITGETELAQGGGVFNSGTMTLRNSTISNNTVRWDERAEGFGIYNSGMLSVINSTVIGNMPAQEPNDNSFGGGIFNRGVMDVANSTITGNAARQGGGITTTEGVGTLRGSIVAGNDAGDCAGPLASNGYNLDGDGSCELDPALGDIPSTAPDLGPLRDNGGRTETAALDESSPAVDAIPVKDCIDIAGAPLLTDQRGVDRPQPVGGNCDIGAFELIQEPIGIDDVIALFDDAVAAGELVGVGPGRSAINRLRALRNMLENASNQIARGGDGQACGQLRRVLRGIDGGPPPPEFADGDALDDLFEAVTMLREGIGCSQSAT